MYTHMFYIIHTSYSSRSRSLACTVSVSDTTSFHSATLGWHSQTSELLVDKPSRSHNSKPSSALASRLKAARIIIDHLISWLSEHS